MTTKFLYKGMVNAQQLGLELGSNHGFRTTKVSLSSIVHLFMPLLHDSGESSVNIFEAPVFFDTYVSSPTTVGEIQLVGGIVTETMLQCAATLFVVHKVVTLDHLVASPCHELEC